MAKKKVTAIDSIGVFGNEAQPLVVSAFLSDSPFSSPPAAVIGTAPSGPAFYPVGLTSVSDLTSVFGSVTGAIEAGSNAVLAAERFFTNGGLGSIFLRTLGAGDCKQRTEDGGNEGRVNKAGFVVGQQLINTATNLLGSNPYAYDPTAGQNGSLGRTYFLACLMSESNGSTIFSDAGIQDSATAVPILRGVLFAASGVILSLSSTYEPNNSPTSTGPAIGTFGISGDGGSNIGSVTDPKKTSSCFTLLLNGHKSTTAYPSEIPLSFDPQATHEDLLQAGLKTNLDLQLAGLSPGESLYFANLLNRDPTRIQQAGHYLYTHYDLDLIHAVVTGSGVITAGDYPNGEPIALLLTSTLGRNTGSVSDRASDSIGIPNFENFEDRFTFSYSPFVMSQKINGKRIDLFRLESFSDGARQFPLKYVVSNIRAGIVEQGSDAPGYASFDIAVYNANVRDGVISEPLYEFTSVDLDPASDNFIAKRIGDRRGFYDFDAPTAGQKTVVDGLYPITNPFVRVKLGKDVEEGTAPPELLPVGFRGISHLITSASNPTGAESILTGSVSANAEALAYSVGPGKEVLKSVVLPPLPFRERQSKGNPAETKLNMTPTNLPWGVQFTKKAKLTDPNAGFLNVTSLPQNLLQYFPSFHTTLQNPLVTNGSGKPDLGGAVIDSDRFNNNLFTLENVVIVTGSTSDGRNVKAADMSEIAAAIYVRNGRLPGSLSSGKKPGTTTDKCRFIEADLDFDDDQLRPFLSFTVPMHAAFDGLNIFDIESAQMSDVSVYRERLNTSLGKSASSTAAYLKAIDILSEKHEADMQLLVIPGIRHRAVTDVAAAAMEEKFDALFIADVEQYKNDGTYITGSDELPDIVLTADNFRNRALNTSFAAAYYPNVRIQFVAQNDSDVLPPTEVPASVAALGVMARNDSLGSVATAPAGFVRGAVSDGVQTNLDFDNSETKILRNNFINVIAPSANVGGTLYYETQLTTLGAKSLLDRVNNRRLLIDIRRNARDIARGFLFMANTKSNREIFLESLRDLMTTYISAGMIEGFRVRPVEQEIDKPRQITDLQNDILINQGNFKPFGDLNNRADSETELKTVRAQIFITPLKSNETILIDINEGEED